MHNEIQYIISGKIPVRYGANILAAKNYLRDGEKTSTLDKGNKHFKKEETARLRKYITKQNLWLKDIDLDNYISEGAEQKVYLKDEQSVVKLNDAIYYLSWVDYFNNLLLNNYFFEDTAYKLLGFFENDSVVYAVVEQSFVKADAKTNLDDVKEFMSANGFQRIRNNDYINFEMGIIIEDLHDENVLTNKGGLYFIDTVFYVNQN